MAACIRSPGNLIAAGESGRYRILARLLYDRPALRRGADSL
jgi:hypothetical protein